MCKMNKEVKATNTHRMGRLFRRTSFFDPSLRWARLGVTFFEEKQSRVKDSKLVQATQFLMLILNIIMAFI
jgi:hypothetical protein